MSLPVQASDFPGVSQNGINFLNNLIAQINSLTTSHNQLRTDMNNHVHGGITAGAANSSGVATTAAAVTSVVAAGSQLAQENT